MKANNFLYFFLGLLLIFGDQITKYLAYSKNFGSFLNFFRPVLGVQISPNYNFVFGIIAPHILVYIFYVLIAVIAVVWFIKHQQKNWILKLAFTLIVSGAVSNVLDRIYFGYVRDFIYIFWGNIFNLADIYITLGIILALVLV